MTRLAAELLGCSMSSLQGSVHSGRQIPQSHLNRSLSCHRPFTSHGDRRRGTRSQATDRAVRPLVTAAAVAVAEPDLNQHVREGASEAELVQLQVCFQAFCQQGMQQCVVFWHNLFVSWRAYTLAVPLTD